MEAEKQYKEPQKADLIQPKRERSKLSFVDNRPQTTSQTGLKVIDSLSVQHQKSTKTIGAIGSQQSVAQLLQAEGRDHITDFFRRWKGDGDAPLYLYTHILSDGFGDAGQLTLLYNEIKKQFNRVHIPLCAFSMEKIFDEGLDREIIIEGAIYDILDKTETTSQEKRSDVEKMIGNRKDAILKNYPMLSLEFSGKRTDTTSQIRKNSFPNVSGWEIEYPVPDDSYEATSDKVLKIREMTDPESGDLHTGGSFDRIGFGIPCDTPAALPEGDKRSAESYLRNEYSDKVPSELLCGAWLVSVKNFKKAYNSPPDLEEGQVQSIKKHAEDANAPIVIFIGITHEPFLSSGQTLVHFCPQMDHVILLDFMNKITNGVILSGGEGMYVESLAYQTSNINMLCGRYDYQYKEIANMLYEDSMVSNIDSISLYLFSRRLPERLVNHGFFKCDDAYYYTKDGESVVNIGKPQNKIGKHSFVGKKASYSQSLSAIYFPYSKNIEEITMPIIFKGNFEIVKEILLRITRNQRAASWFKLIHQEDQ